MAHNGRVGGFVNYIIVSLKKKNAFRMSVVHPLRSGLYFRGKRKERFYLLMHSTHFIYAYVESDIW